jgi:hypothetical protein
VKLERQLLNQRRVRELRFYFEYEYNAETKDQIEDLLTLYSSADDIVTRAIATLHEQHFGSISKRTPPTYKQTFSGNSEVANEKLDELWQYVQALKEFQKDQIAAQAEKVTNAKNQVHFSDETNKKILEKIDDLGMRFSKIVSEADKETGKKAITTDMSNEEVLQLIKRIDQLESKLTKAISQSRATSAPARTGRREIRDFGDAPKIGPAKPIEGQPMETEERPLLEDVLDTIIVTVERDEDD